MGFQKQGDRPDDITGLFLFCPVTGRMDNAHTVIIKICFILSPRYDA